MLPSLPKVRMMFRFQIRDEQIFASFQTPWSCVGQICLPSISQEVFIYLPVYLAELGWDNKDRTNHLLSSQVKYMALYGWDLYSKINLNPLITICGDGAWNDFRGNGEINYTIKPKQNKWKRSNFLFKMWIWKSVHYIIVQAVVGLHTLRRSFSSDHRNWVMCLPLTLWGVVGWLPAGKHLPQSLDTIRSKPEFSNKERDAPLATETSFIFNDTFSWVLV